MAHLFPTLLIALILLSSSPQISGSPSECDVGPANGCHDKPAALRLKIIAICAILVTSMIGVCLPLITRSIPAVHPDRNLFSVVKAFASGVFLATRYMHVMPDSFDDLRSDCLPENPQRKFPFTTFVAMLSAVITLMVDSFAMSFYRKRNSGLAVYTDPSRDPEMVGHVHAHYHKEDKQSLLLRYGLVAQVRIIF
ncbi:fe(2+) transport protein 1-like [Magnolia sinica]|uniref:fe(2+) transport protein 1-like n=1 Tax=Magnolia sinica TaxID=86752 RepID=UPI0026590376|nr:fe(2+) transport protein 1-like [Magnolia sinica]